MSVKVSRILHAGYIFEHQGCRIAFDPIFETPFSRNCYSFPKIEFNYQEIEKLNFDAVFISHYHDDHCSLESLNLLSKKIPIYIFCIHDELISWLKELGFECVIQINLGVKINIGPFSITPLRALDYEVDSIFHLQVDGLNILNVVDSWIDNEIIEVLAQVKQWDLVLWPFQTMRELEVISPLRAEPSDSKMPAELMLQLQKLAPKNLVASSCQFIHEPWSWYNQAFFPISYTDFAKQVTQALPDANVLRLDPGKTIQLNHLTIAAAESLEWIRPLESFEVDYQYNSNLKVPSMSDVAKNFKNLKEEQKRRVEQFCNFGLASTYAELEPTNSSYFRRSRIWQLIVYDSQGVGTNYFYRMKGDKIIFLEKPDEVPTWLTEIAEAKLYSALETGESLTSLYLRINDVYFDSTTEEELIDVDLIEDPLIRCLFAKEFGSYQKAQLQKIKNDQAQSQ
jgi:hypothetical protein